MGMTARLESWCSLDRQEAMNDEIELPDEANMEALASETHPLSTPSPDAMRKRFLTDTSEHVNNMTPPAERRSISPKRRRLRRLASTGEIRSLMGLGVSSKLEPEPFHVLSDSEQQSPERATVAKPHVLDIELRVVQSDFMDFTLSSERRGLRISGPCTPGVSGIRANDLIVKVGGIAVHSKARQRPPLCDGMAITVKRLLSPTP